MEQESSWNNLSSLRVVRALADFRPPYGAREPAQRSDTPATSISRVVAVLDRDALVERSADGAILDVRWRDMLLRRTQDYGLTRSNRVSTPHAPRNLNMQLPY